MARLKDLKVTIGLSKKGLTKLNGDLRRTKANFRRNFGEIAGMAKKVATVIATGLAAGLTALVKSGSDLQTLRVGFRSIMGSAEGAARMVDKLNTFTASTPFQLEEVSRSARQLIAVGVGVDDVNDRLRMLGDIAAASGNSISEISAIFAKVQAKGKVDLESLNQMAERGIPIFDTLREVTGDMNMEFGAGAVSVEQYNAALAVMADEGGFANDAMANLSETVSGRLTTAFDNITLALGNFAEKSGLLSSISNLLEDFTNQIQRASLSEADLQKSREQFFDIREKLKRAHKGNIEDLMNEAHAAEKLARALDQVLDTKNTAGHLSGVGKIIDEIEEAFAFKDTSLSMLPDAPASAPTTGIATPGAELKEKKELLEVEKSRLLTMGMAQKMHGTMASDIMAASMANHSLKGSYEEVGASIEATQMKTTELSKVFTASAKAMAAAAGRIAGAMMAGTASARDMGNMVLSTLAGLAVEVGQMAIGVGIAIEGIKKALRELKGVAAIAAGVALIALGSFVRASLRKKADMGNVPQMADGGLFTGASLAMVGEGPGTSSINPEVVAPLDKLQKMMGGGNVVVTGMISGSDILLSNERSALDRNRVRGF